jgi:hypothetical protein
MFAANVLLMTTSNKKERRGGSHVVLTHPNYHNAHHQLHSKEGNKLHGDTYTNNLYALN